MIRRAVFLPLAVLLLLSPPLVAEFRELDHPEIVFEAECPELARKAVRAALKRSEREFLGGAELNGMTSLRYRGPTEALNRFLGDLAKCLAVTIRISFSNDLDEATDWRVFHEPHGHSFHIEIDHHSGQIDLGKLVIPEIGKPPVGLY